MTDARTGEGQAVPGCNYLGKCNSGRCPVHGADGHTLRVLAIDPGPQESAWCWYVDNRPESAGKWPNEQLRAGLEGVPASGCVLVVEQIASFGMAVGEEVFETVFWSGRFVEAWRGEFARVKRLECKMHLCHDSRAKDPNIRQALIDRFGKPGTRNAPGVTFGFSGDMWAALAVAVTYADGVREPAAAEGGER